MRILLGVLIYVVASFLFGQNKANDDVIFQSATDWLDNKLNYVYYDEVNGKWWTNTFYINENKYVTIKHISSEKRNTANIRDKVYTIRSFQLEDINPKSLKIKEVEKTQGRIVKGKMLELRTFGFQELIHKTINNRRGSSTSYLFLSFPEVLTDSISDYAEIVRNKLEVAINASTRLYPADGNDVETIFSILTGGFESDNGKDWIGTLTQENVVKIENEKEKILYIGYDRKREQFYTVEITSEEMKTQYLTLEAKDQYRLKLGEETVMEFYSLHSFSYRNQDYFRK